MDPIEERLSRIETSWAIVRKAHDDPRGSTSRLDAQRAQQDLINRYGGAVRRYALAALRNEEAAEEVFQEFALRFVRGDFSNADPHRGRFRSFVKTVVYRLIVDFQRRAKRNARVGAMLSSTPEPEAPTDEQHEELFAATWRDDLLARVWVRLEERQASDGKPYHTALRLRVDHPDLRSPELAEKLSDSLGKPMKAGATRVLLHRAREAFAELLLEEVAHTLPEPSRDRIEQELIDLNLFEYCRPAFEKKTADEAEGD